MIDQQPQYPSTPVTLSINGVAVTGTLTSLTAERALFLARTGAADELYVGGPAEIFKTEGGETVAFAEPQ